MTTARASRRALVGALFGVVALVGGPAEAQFLHSDPTVCSTPFKPVSGITFHAGSQWALTWHAPPGQFGSAVFAGYPNPVISVGGNKRWDNPIAFVSCWIDWYLEGLREVAYYRWHLESYGGEVTNCTSGSGPNMAPEYFDGVYDPYDPYDPYGTSNCGGSGGGNGGGGGGCVAEYFVVEISYDGGNTWHTLWEGWGTVCD